MSSAAMSAEPEVSGVKEFFSAIVDNTTEEVKKILAGKTCLELMFTVHVEESLAAVLHAISVEEGTIHMSRDQHTRWKTVSDKNKWNNSLRPVSTYSKRPSIAFEQLITLAESVSKLDPPLKVPGLPILQDALTKLEKKL